MASLGGGEKHGSAPILLSAFFKGSEVKNCKTDIVLQCWSGYFKIAWDKSSFSQNEAAAKASNLTNVSSHTGDEARRKMQFQQLVCGGIFCKANCPAAKMGT